jgi:hypothetical protein
VSWGLARTHTHTHTNTDTQKNTHTHTHKHRTHHTHIYTPTPQTYTHTLSKTPPGSGVNPRRADSGPPRFLPPPGTPLGQSPIIAHPTGGNCYGTRPHDIDVINSTPRFLPALIGDGVRNSED